MTKRRSQAERRAETRAAVLSSACKLFGEKGYVDTSLEDIGLHCGVTIRPIYHYFGNKKALFAAVAGEMEQRIINAHGSIDTSNSTDVTLQGWRAFLDLCQDPAFRRVVLIDAPNILGRERWKDTPVAKIVARKMLARFKEQGDQMAELAARMVIGALTEAGLMIAEADDPDGARQQADILVSGVIELLSAGKGDFK